MDVMPSMNTNAVALGGPGGATTALALPADAAAFGAALKDAVGGPGGPDGLSVESKGGLGAEVDTLQSKLGEAAQGALSAAMGLNGLIEARVPLGGPPGVVVLGKGLMGSALVARQAAQGLTGLTAALQGTRTPGTEGQALLGLLDAVGLQDEQTQDLAHLLAERHGPLPRFDGDAGAATEGAPVHVEDSVALGAGLDESQAGDAATGPSMAALPTGKGDGQDVDASQVHFTPPTPTSSVGSDGLTLPSGAPALGAPGLGTSALPTATPATPVTYASATPLLPPGISEAAVLRQINDGLRLMTDGGRTAAEIRLEPAELGKMSVRLEVEGARVRMFVTTENAGVRDLVAQGLDQLRRDLLAQGLQTVHVEIRQREQGFGQGHRDQRRPDEDGAALLDDGIAETAPAARPSLGRSGGRSGRVDLTA